MNLYIDKLNHTTQSPIKIFLVIANKSPPDSFSVNEQSGPLNRLTIKNNGTINVNEQSGPLNRLTNNKITEQKANIQMIYTSRLTKALQKKKRWGK